MHRAGNQKFPSLMLSIAAIVVCLNGVASYCENC